MAFTISGRSRNRLLLSIIGGLLLGSPDLHARAVGFAGSTTASVTHQPYLADTDLIHSLTKDFAIAATFMRLETPREILTMLTASVHWLVKRWNLDHGQSNFFLRGGYGWMKHRRLEGTATQFGVDADYETLRLYGGLKFDIMDSAHSETITLTRIRAGFAPIVSDYDGVSPFLLLQLQSTPQLERTSSLTPMVRLIASHWILELGVSLDGDVLSGLTVQF